MLHGRSAGQLALRSIPAVQPVISITANYRSVKSRNAGGIGRAVDNGASAPVPSPPAPLPEGEGRFPCMHVAHVGVRPAFTTLRDKLVNGDLTPALGKPPAGHGVRPAGRGSLGGFAGE